MKSALSKFPFAMMLLGTIAGKAQQPPDTGHQLPSVEIRSERVHRAANKVDSATIAASPSESLDNLLERMPAVEVRNRSGQQGDISLRGGSSDQAMLLLNGINMNDAHTGHYTLDLPVDARCLQRMELLDDSPLAHFGLSAFSGIIALYTRIADTTAPPLTLSLHAGSHGEAGAALNLRQRRGGWYLLEHAAYSRSDGYIHNTDHRQADLFLQAYRPGRHDDSWNLQGGFQLKDYGANAFYSLSYPDQYESVRMAFASASYRREWAWGRWEWNISNRAHTDRFELFRDGHSVAPDWYSGHNYHLSNTLATNHTLAIYHRHATTTLGIDLRDEAVLSSQLGDSLEHPVRIVYESGGKTFDFGKNRLNVNSFIQHHIHRHRWELCGGGALNLNTMFQTSWGADLRGSYHLNDHLHLHASAGRYLRMPTFTDLYYHNAVQVGNDRLQPEKAWIATVSADWHDGPWHVSLTLLRRNGRDIIDWIRQPDESLWHCANLTHVNLNGLEMSASYRPGGSLREVRLDYTWYHIDKSAGDYVSKYALDHLRHKLSLSAVQQLGRSTVSGWASVQKRNGSYTDKNGDLAEYTPVVLVDLKWEYPWRKLRLSLSLLNLLNRRHYDIGGIEQPGLQLRGGITYSL